MNFSKRKKEKGGIWDKKLRYCPFPHYSRREAPPLLAPCSAEGVRQQKDCPPSPRKIFEVFLELWATIDCPPLLPNPLFISASWLCLRDSRCSYYRETALNSKVLKEVNEAIVTTAETFRSWHIVRANQPKKILVMRAHNYIMSTTGARESLTIWSCWETCEWTITLWNHMDGLQR